MYTESEINLITLCSIEGLTYKNRFELLNGLESSEPDFVKCEKILIKTLTGGVYNKVKDSFYSSVFREKVLKELENDGVECVTYFSQNYPEPLKNIPCPPITLFCKGNTKLLSGRAFAAVGSRRTQPEVLKALKTISEELSRHFTVVSGIADGADTAVLEGAIESGKVISVLANGFDHVYPSVNAPLLKRLVKKGLVITEYTSKTKPEKFNFPVRNRIIAGLSEGVLIASAAEKSGALITAHYALEYDRRVFAIPYSINVKSGAGCNALIKEGATLCRNTLDILDDFGMEFKPSEKVTLSKEESELLSLIRETGAAFVPDLAVKTGKKPYEIIPVLSKLEIKGFIVRLGGNRYSAV